MSNTTLFKSRDDVRVELALFGVRSYCLLVDDSERQLLFEPDDELECRGLYTFTAAAAGRTMMGYTVQLLPSQDAPPECDAWLVATASKAVYPLVRYLYEQDRKTTLVFPLAQAGITSLFSYVDFFKGETDSVVYIHNVFERAYKIHFPIAVRWLLRDLDGVVVRASQEIVAHGKDVWQNAKCWECHGQTGKGDGEKAAGRWLKSSP